MSKTQFYCFGACPNTYCGQTRENRVTTRLLRLYSTFH